MGDANHPYAVYDFTSDRSRAAPETFLSEYRGYLQADAYGGYGIYLQAEALSQRDDTAAAQSGRAHQLQGVIEVACWTHCRRYWHKAASKNPRGLITC